MIYLFGNCLLDSDRRELRHGTSDAKVEPQVFDLLLYAIRHRARVVTRDELIAAVWRGRIVSESTISSRISAARKAIGDTGAMQHLIRTYPRVGLRFVGDVTEGDTGASGRTAPRICASSLRLARHHGAPIGRLPKSLLAIDRFLALADDAEQRSFLAGIVEEITTALCQIPWISVVMRRPADGVIRYALEGCVRTDDCRLRITARLVEPASGVLLWTKRFEAPRCEKLDVQDQIAGSVVEALGPRLERFEIDRSRCESIDISDPLQCYWLGMGRLYEWNREGMREALALFSRASELDPEFASASGMAAYCSVQRKSYGWISDREQENDQCERLARQAAASAGDDAVALTKAAHAIASLVGDTDSAGGFIDRALRLNPALAIGWYVSGWIKLFIGETEAAREHLDRAVRLGPSDPLSFKMRAAVAYAHFFAGRYDSAALEAERAICERPSYLTAIRAAAAAHAVAGRLERARLLIARMQELDPKIRLGALPDLIPFRNAADAERWANALRRAGLPE